jgi:hypothetical protein
VSRFGPRLLELVSAASPTGIPSPGPATRSCVAGAGTTGYH